MKGLLVKDLRIVLAQKRYICMIGALGILMAVTQQNGSFCIMYMTMIAAIMAVSTLNYDAYEENGMAYLMMLPVKRSAYVIEKYVFSFGTVSMVSILFSFVGLLYSVLSGEQEVWTETLVYCVAAIVMGIMVMSLMIPANLKFGAEKSRVALMIFGGGILAVFYPLKIAMEKYPKVHQVLSKLEEVPGWQWGIVLTLAVALILTVSMLISIKVMEEKDF